MTMTDPNDVRRQFEAWARRETDYDLARIAMTGEYSWGGAHDAFKGYQAALQSPAVRELVEALGKMLDAFNYPVPDPDDDELEAIRAGLAALRTLGAGHVE